MIISLGERVFHRVTGYQGIVTAICEYLDGLITVQVTSLKEDNTIHTEWLSASLLDKVEA